MHKIISNSIAPEPPYLEEILGYCDSNQGNIISTHPNHLPKPIKLNKGKTSKHKVTKKRAAPYPTRPQLTKRTSKPTLLTPTLDHLASYLPPNTFNEDKAKEAIKNIETQKQGASINELERAVELIERYLIIKHPGYIGARGRASQCHSINQDILKIYKNIKGQISAINCRLRKKENEKALEQRLETLIQKCEENDNTIQELRLELIRLQNQIDQQNK